MQFKFATPFLAVALVAIQLTAQTVVIERAPDPALLAGGAIGAIYSDRPTQEVSPLTVVTLTEETTINAITVFTTNLNEAFPSVGYPVGGSSAAVLNIFVGSTLAITDDTLSGGVFGNPFAIVDYIATDDGIEITANNLDITLPATTYLIGITPRLTFSTHGQEFFLDAGSNGDTTFLNNPGGALFNPIFGMETVNANVLDLPTAYTGMAIRITTDTGVLKGDVNQDGVINLLDVAPFVDAISNGTLIPEADVNCDGVVNLLDVEPFVALLSG